MDHRSGWVLSPAGLALVALLAGCAATVNETKEPNDLVGRWRQVSIATGERSANCPASLSLPDGFTTSCGDNDVIEFHRDGTFTATFSGSPVKGAGTWRLAGNNLVLSFTAPPAVAGTSHSATVSFDNGGKTINIDAMLIGAVTTETYMRL